MNILIGVLSGCAALSGLFFIEMKSEARYSKALWIPTIWMLLVCSRPLSEWTHFDRNANIAGRFTDGSPLEASVYGILIAAGLLVLNRRPYKVASLFRLNTPLFLFICFCAISVLWSDYPFVGFKRWIKGAGTLVMVLIVLSDSDPVTAIRRFFSRIAFLLLPLSVLLIACFPDLGTMYDSDARRTFYVGVTTQKNELGLISLICGLGSLWALIGAYENREMKYRMRHMIGHGVIVVTAFWLIKTCDSMTSFSCLVISGGVMVMTGRAWVRRRAGNAGTIVWGAIGIAIFAALLDSSGVLLHLLGRNATLTGRTDVWKAVLAMHTNPLLGAGYESFWMGNRLEDVWRMVGFKNFAEAHNGYLEIYITLGWLGLTMLGILVASGFRNALASLRMDPIAGRLKLAIFTATLIFNLSEAGFKMMGPVWVVFLIAITDVGRLTQQETVHRPLEKAALTMSRQTQVRVLQ